MNSEVVLCPYQTCCVGSMYSGGSVIPQKRSSSWQHVCVLQAKLKNSKTQLYNKERQFNGRVFKNNDTIKLLKNRM